MNYPIWDLQNIGGGTLIASIAVIHAFVAHFAVGGGLFLVLTEMKAIRTKNAELMAYVQKHTKFFLLLTMVFGGITGVGIWFSIALVSPAATSSLIHNFVFGWATEWVFFMGEIVALLIYHYRFGKMKEKDHVAIGWLYFIFAWLSLFIINGILTFMLTPGQWLATQSFWHGFFNPGMWSALFYRTGIAFLIAGIFGLITAVRSPESLKKSLFRYCLQWIYIPALLIILSGFWYFKMTPQTSVENLLHFNPEATRFVNYIIFGSIGTFLVALLFLIKLPGLFQKIALGLLIVVGFAWYGGFEYLREIARKPFVLNQYMYSNGLLKTNVETYNNEGFLKHAKWSPIKEISDDNLLQAGEQLYKLQCHACHTLTGYNPLVPKTAKLTERGLVAMMDGLGKFNTYMPPFAGTMQEKEALAAYIFRSLHGNEKAVDEVTQKTDLPVQPSPFDSKKSDYVLLAWNDLGMHCISDNDKYFNFLPPANALWSQLIKRGAKPEVVSEGVRVEFEVEEGFRHPEKQVPFWDYAKVIFGADLQPGIGLGGFGVAGTMHVDAVKKVFKADFIPVTPYNDDGTYNPFPLFTLKAFDEKTNALLAETQVVAPTSTEMGCRNCHQGGWRWNNVSGVSDLTAENILATHDRMNGTSLLEDAKNGQPKLCQSCHADPAVGAPGMKGIPNFSTSMHGFHANYLSNSDHTTCAMCHPAKETGNTRCNRGRHSVAGITCIDCHGTLEDHALSLLKHENDLGLQGAKRMMSGINPRDVETVAQVNPRMPWLNEPNCLGCHTNFDIVNQGDVNSFNEWYDGFSSLYRNTSDYRGVMCSACHSSTHAIYAADNMYGAMRDNLQPLQYQGVAGTIGTQNNCAVCHTKRMTVNGHHANMIKQ
jgi:mono/diheme cytochrome c family protein